MLPVSLPCIIQTNIVWRDILPYKHTKVLWCMMPPVDDLFPYLTSQRIYPGLLHSENISPLPPDPFCCGKGSIFARTQCHNQYHNMRKVS